MNILQIMKTKYYILLLLISFFVYGCSDDDSGTSSRNELKLEASEETLKLDEEKLNEPAITFSWNKATDIGADYQFSYIFQLDIANNNFESATEPVILDVNSSYSFTALELYNLIVEKWKKTAGEPVQLEGRIVAKVDGPKFQYPEISYKKIEITTYIPETTPLFIIGTATEAGLDPSKAILMNELSNGRIYNWKGKLEVGNFKFITSLGSMLPSLNKGKDDNTLVERQTEEDPDTYFEVTEAGTYNIYLAKWNMTISWKKVTYETLFMVGDGCAAGWELNNLISMKADELNPNIFTYTGPLMEGEIKILTKADWDAATFRPLVPDASIDTDTDVQITPDNTTDYKWKITAQQAGTYKITLDIESMKIKFEKQ